MQSQYPETYAYIYEIIDQQRITDLLDMDAHHRTTIINLLLISSDQDVIDSLTHGDHPMPADLMRALIDMDKKDVREIRQQAIDYFWSNVQHILKEIFDDAEDAYEKEFGIESDYEKCVCAYRRERMSNIVNIFQENSHVR